MRKCSTSARPRLFDCFTFFDELDVLELRLKELDNIVDRFVLVEGTRTFSGRPKRLLFQENKQRFRAYLGKIEHVILNDSDFPDGDVSAWDREYLSRRAMLQGLKGASPDDFVLISDVDEIPRPDALVRVLERPTAGREFTVFSSACYFYFLNLRATDRPPSLVQAPRLLQRRYVRDPQAVRAFKAKVSKRDLGRFEPVLLGLRACARFGFPLKVVIEPASSWHFKYFGGAHRIRAKILAFSHVEKAIPANLDIDLISKSIADRKYMFDATEKLEEVPLDASLPRALQADPLRWIHGLTTGTVMMQAAE